MRIVFLTHYYPPEVGAPQARISTLARLLAARGHRVTVHTGLPNYPDGRVHPPYRVRPLTVEQEHGVRVVRSAVYPTPNRGVGRRLGNHLSFAVSALCTAPAARAADVVVAESPPLFTAAAAVPYAAVKRAPLILNVADRWPASAIALGVLRSRAAVDAAARLELACYRRAQAVTVPTSGLAWALSSLPEADGKVRRLGPAVDTSRFLPSEPPATGPLRVLYAGTLGLAQGVDTLLQAASLAGPQVEVWIAGDGAEGPELRRRVELERPRNVRLMGTVPHADIPALYARAHAACVLLRDRPLFAAAMPTKLPEAMAAGRPVVVSARGESARLVEESGAGVVVPPEDPGALADALRQLAADRHRARRLGEAGRRAALERFDWQRVADGWAALLETVVSRRTAPGRAFAAPRHAG